MARNGWHIGERLIHKKLGHENDYSIMMLYADIEGDLPGEHAVFHSTRLPFVPITTLDTFGRPWSSILAGPEGKPGFIQNSRYSVLSVNAKVWPGEPIIENAKLYDDSGSMLIAGIGIEFPTRRRNKFAGKVTKLELDGDALHLDLLVDEALGNCPKYINVRDLIPHPNTTPKMTYDRRRLDSSERLPEEIIFFITESDTVFFGTTYSAPQEEAKRYPSHLGMNQRGGRQGFVRVVPSDGRTVVLPDYSGNRFLTSLGNIEATPFASLTFVSFTTGNILYLTGEAKNLFNRDAQQLMPLQNALTTVYITGYIYVSDALPVRQQPGSSPQRSPYSPPIRLLAEESSSSTHFDDSKPVTAHLTRIVLHCPAIATFTWESSTPLSIVPGQAIIMNFTPLLGGRQYQHMAPLKPTSVNDDRIRTWTVSSSSDYSNAGTLTADSKKENTSFFSITMRERSGGLVTGALFNITRKLAEAKPELLEDTRLLSIVVNVLGVTGDFVLPPVSPPKEGGAEGLPLDNLAPSLPQPHPHPAHLPITPTAQPITRLLWIAGGIGVTPFLAMLNKLQLVTTPAHYDIKLMLSAREPEVILPLITAALLPHPNPNPYLNPNPYPNPYPYPNPNPNSNGLKTQPVIKRLSIIIFTHKEIPLEAHAQEMNNNTVTTTVILRKHTGRIVKETFLDAYDAAGGMDLTTRRKVYVCGPESFEKAVVAILEGLGVEQGSVKRESFTY